MHLTGLILFVGFFGLFIYWAYRLFSIRKVLHLVSKKELREEYLKGILLFVVIAISAGMAWG